MDGNKAILRQLIKEIVREVISEIKLDELHTETPVTKAKAFALEKGLLTEKTVLKLYAEQYDLIQVDKPVVITPLARETARSKGIRIKKRSQTC